MMPCTHGSYKVNGGENKRKGTRHLRRSPGKHPSCSPSAHVTHETFLHKYTYGFPEQRSARRCSSTANLCVSFRITNSARMAIRFSVPCCYGRTLRLSLFIRTQPNDSRRTDNSLPQTKVRFGWISTAHTEVFEMRDYLGACKID